MLSTFDVNPRWSAEAEEESSADARTGTTDTAHRGLIRAQNASPPSTGNRNSINTTGGGGGQAHEDMLDVPAPQQKRASRKAQLQHQRQRRGSWCIDVPMMEDGDSPRGGGGGKKTVDNNTTTSHSSRSHPPGRAEVSDTDPESSASQLSMELNRHTSGMSAGSSGSASVRSRSSGSATATATTTGAAASAKIYERARKNLFGTGGGLDGTGSGRSLHGGDGWDLSTGPPSAAGAGSGSRSHDPQPPPTTAAAPPPQQKQDAAATTNTTTLPPWMKDKLRKDRLQREESSRSSCRPSSGRPDDFPDSYDSDHHYHHHHHHSNYTMSLSQSRPGNNDSTSESDDALAPRRTSVEHLVRRERRSKSAWGGKGMRAQQLQRRASEGDTPDHDNDNSHGDGGHQSFADQLEDLHDELDDEKVQQRRASSSDNRPADTNGDLEAAIVRRSYEAGQLGHSGRFAAPRRRGSSRGNLQDVDFEPVEGDLGDDGGDDVESPRHDPSTTSETGVNKHHSSPSPSAMGSPSSSSANRSGRAFRVLFNSDGASHLEPTRNHRPDDAGFGDFDFDPLDYKDYTSNVVHNRRHQRRMNWCRTATVVMAICAVVLATMTAYEKLAVPSSPNSPASSSTTGVTDSGGIGTDWAAESDALSSVKLPTHIESNLADWTSFAPSVQGQRRDQNYKTQRMNDEMPEAEQSTPLLWSIPFSGSTVTEEVFGQCLRLVQTSDLGVSNGHESDESLSVVQVRGHSYVNVDTTTFAGVQHAKELGLVESGLSEVISTPLLHDVAKSLFDATHQGRAFVVLRNPIDRAMATYHSLTTGRFHGPDGETLDQLSTKTLQEYAESDFCDDNWLTRTLVNKPDGKLSTKDINLAKAILRRKAIIGLYSDLGNSIQHFTDVFGWDAPPSIDCANDLIGRAYAREQEGFPKLDTDEPAFEVIQNKNKFDLELYNFAVQLRYQQLSMR